MCFKCRKNDKSKVDIDEVITETKLGEILKEKDEEHKKNTVVIVICIISAVLALAAIGHFIYKLVKPDYLKDYEEDDDFDDFEDIDDLDDLEDVDAEEEKKEEAEEE